MNIIEQLEYITEHAQEFYLAKRNYSSDWKLDIDLSIHETTISKRFENESVTQCLNQAQRFVESLMGSQEVFVVEQLENHSNE